MQDLGQLGDAVSDPRRRPREVGVRVHADRGRRQLDPGRLGLGASAVEPAGRHHDQLRPLGGDRVPRGRVRRLAGQAQHVLAARQVDHLGHPVPGGKRRVEPLGHEHPPRRPAGDGLHRRDDRPAHAGDDRGTALAGVGTARVQAIGQQAHAGLDLADRVRVERDHLGGHGAQP